MINDGCVYRAESHVLEMSRGAQLGYSTEKLVRRNTPQRSIQREPSLQLEGGQLESNIVGESAYAFARLDQSLKLLLSLKETQCNTTQKGLAVSPGSMLPGKYNR